MRSSVWATRRPSEVGVLAMNIKCDCCDRDAVVHVTEMDSAGLPVERHLCELHAGEAKFSPVQAIPGLSKKLERLLGETRLPEAGGQESSTPRRVVYVPTSALVGFMLSVLSWLLVALLWAGRQWTDGQWPGRLKVWVAVLVAIAATVYLFGWGRPAWRANPMPPGDTIGVTRGQAFWVVLIVVAAGAFGTWLVCGQPNPFPWIG
jgi:hypothetical protein